MNPADHDTDEVAQLKAIAAVARKLIHPIRSLSFFSVHDNGDLRYYNLKWDLEKVLRAYYGDDL